MRIRLPHPEVQAWLRRILTAALAAVDPANALRRSVRRTGSTLRVGAQRYDLRRYRRVVAVGAGKASARMGAALERVLGDRLDEGLVVVKYGYGAPTKQITVLEAGHPVPDRAGLRAAARLHALVRSLGPDDLLFVLLSGGASSLLPAPAPGLTLADTQRTSRLLLASGAGIQEINAVRKHLSSLKGGRLAAATQARVVTVILSDVLGDDLAAIGSGPTAPDPTTFEEACAILRRYGLWRAAPARVQRHLRRGCQGLVAETAKPGARIFDRVQHQIIGNNVRAVVAAARAARHAGLKPLILTTTLTGEAREAGRVFGALAREIVAWGRPIAPPCCVLAGGELTVTVRGRGLGGRAQEFALAAAREIAGLSRVWIAGFGTDGTDGPTDAAGAVVDGRTLARAARVGLDAAAALARHDAYPFFRRAGGHIVTGPTGTNVNDLYLLMVR
ncbi:glycerate kinase type-2 family protein [Nitrospira sp. Kam-Ns4a]